MHFQFQNFCTSQTRLSGWGQGDVFWQISALFVREEWTPITHLWTVIQGHCQNQAEVVSFWRRFIEESGSKGRVPSHGVSIWQGLSCWRPGRQGCSHLSLVLPQQHSSALQICLVCVLCCSDKLFLVSELVCFMFAIGGQGWSVPVPDDIPSHLIWQQRPTWSEGRPRRSMVGKKGREWLYNLLGQNWLMGRNKTYWWLRECCLLNKPAQWPFSVTEAMEHCHAPIYVADRSPLKIKSDCLDTTSWKWFWLLTSSNHALHVRGWLAPQAEKVLIVHP